MIWIQVCTDLLSNFHQVVYPSELQYLKALKELNNQPKLLKTYKQKYRFPQLIFDMCLDAEDKDEKWFAWLEFMGYLMVLYGLLGAKERVFTFKVGYLMEQLGCKRALLQSMMLRFSAQVVKNDFIQ